MMRTDESVAAILLSCPEPYGSRIGIENPVVLPDCEGGWHPTNGLSASPRGLEFCVAGVKK